MSKKAESEPVTALMAAILVASSVHVVLATSNHSVMFWCLPTDLAGGVHLPRWALKGRNKQQSRARGRYTFT